jgi:hypothetical protein
VPSETMLIVTVRIDMLVGCFSFIPSLPSEDPTRRPSDPFGGGGIPSVAPLWEGGVNERGWFVRRTAVSEVSSRCSSTGV